MRQPTPAVRLSNHRLVSGQVAPDGSHVQYFGIPYATVRRRHRFKAAGLEPEWDGVFNAVNEHVRCPQKFADNFVWGQEDCLIINIFHPLYSEVDKLLPVKVFIHGGGFREGSSSRLLFGPDYLVRKNIVLVTFNYRVAVTGFLCLGIKDAPGNAGLKDQVAALKWVQRNIKVFGGDPDNVTIFGESAGAASVSLHIVSPASKGLFHKAILQSGSSISPWAVEFEPIKYASRVAEVLGYKTMDPYQLYDIHMNHTIESIVGAPVPLLESQVAAAQLINSPCIEKSHPGVEPFLLESPFDIFTRGEYNKVPVILGVNDNEGYYFSGLEDSSTLTRFKFEIGLPRNLRIPAELKKEVCQKLHKMYMSEDSNSMESILKFLKYHADPFFLYPAFAETKLLLQNNDLPVYNYYFRYDGWRNFVKLISGFWAEPGASHADDLMYLFSIFPVPTLFESKIIDRMTTMWTNFAKFGDPTPEKTDLLPIKWYPTNQSFTKTLVIDKEFTITSFKHNSFDFWHDLYKKYRRKN